jgi:hypothetical protein
MIKEHDMNRGILLICLIALSTINAGAEEDRAKNHHRNTPTAQWEGRLAADEAVLAAMKSQLDALAAANAGLNASNASLTTQVNSLAASNASLGGLVAALNSQLTLAQGALATLGNRMTIAENLTAALNAQGINLTSANSNLLVQVTNLTNKLATDETLLAALAGSGQGTGNGQLDSRLAAVESGLASVRNNSVLALDGKLTLDATNPQIPVARFSAVNVQIVNGMNSTLTRNGAGNLIIGYNEADDSSPYVCSDGTDPLMWGPDLQGSCPDIAWGPNQRQGSHNLVVGFGHSYTQYGGMVIGLYNSITGAFSSVSGGTLNSALGNDSSMSGGAGNIATGSASSVSGGVRNIANSDYASVSAGYENKASGRFSGVSGGRNNTASGFDSSVSGGFQNLATSTYASVSGGFGNSATALSSSVSGGELITESNVSGWAAGGSTGPAYHNP